MRTFRNIVVVSLFLCVLSPITVLAQFNMTDLGGPEIEISLQPAYPQPGDEVEASVNDYSSGLYGSAITWQIDGETVTEGNNRRSVTFIAGAAGSNQLLTVNFTRPNGDVESITKTVSPAYLDIILEPQTRVPDFYLGRSLPSIGSIINATALVSDGGAPRTTDLIYTWKLDNTPIEGGPLRGGYKVSFVTPMGGGSILSVRVTEQSGETVASRAITIPSVLPTIRFYEVSALFGVSHNSIENTLALTGNTATVRAEPYHLDSRVFNNPSISEWEVNNQRQTLSNNPYEVTLQRIGTLGNSRLEFHVRDTSQVLQGAKRNITITY